MILTIALLAGCYPGGFALNVSKTLNNELKPFEESQEASIDLGQAIPGAWDRVAIVCPGTRPDELNSALGFVWADSREVTRTDFLGMLVFAQSGGVAGYYSVGQNDFYENHFYFTPCPVDPMEILSLPTRPIVLSRLESEVTFRFTPNVGYWYIDGDTLATLANRR